MIDLHLETLKSSEEEISLFSWFLENRGPAREFIKEEREE